MGLLLVSACLIGLPARYDGRCQANHELMTLLKGLSWAPVCPEQLGGLATPRPPSRLIDGDGQAVLDGQARVIDDQNRDLTAAYLQGAEATLELARLVETPAVFLRARSPSCGSVPRRGSDGSPRPIGVTAARLMRAGIRLIEVEEQGVSDEARCFLAALV